MSKVQLGVRLPEKVVIELRDYCETHGLIIAMFVKNAVEEKLQEAKENEEDIATIEARKNEPSMKEAQWNKYLKSRGIDV